MLAKRSVDRLDSILDSALARSANVSAPPGLEERILAKVARKKARIQRGVQSAAFIMTIGFFFSTLFHPGNSATTPAGHTVLTIHPTIEVIEVEDATNDTPALQSVVVSRPRSSFPPMDQAPEPPINNDDSFISDFEVESLTMTALHLPDLSENP